MKSSEGKMKASQSHRKIVDFLSWINDLNKNRNQPFAILIGIISYEVMKINFQIVFKEMHNSTALFDNSWVLATVAGSTILGLFSDRFIGCSWRKPTVLAGMIFSFITSILFLWQPMRDPSNKYSILVLVIANGFLGGYLGAIRAFYLDQFSKNKTLHFSITVIFQCISWIIIGILLSEELIPANSIRYISPILIGISIFAILISASDTRKPQYEARHASNELKEILLKYNRIRDWSIISSFFLLAISYQLMPYLGEYAFQKSSYYREFLILGLGVGLGVPIALYISTRIEIVRILKISYATSFLFFFIIGVLSWTNIIQIEKRLTIIFFIFAVIGGVIWIISVKEFLQKSKFTEDGFILGFIESIQSLGEFAGAGFSAFLASTIITKKTFPVWPFLILLIVAFLLISIENIIKFIKLKSDYNKDKNN